MSATPATPTQPSLRRLRQFGVRPKRDLGQNFLVDSNILGVIERAAELAPEDVVLEVGGGLGVLSEHLAPRAAHVHVVEVDPALVPALRDALDAHPNTTLHVADAMTLDLAALDPAPTKVVANLPYGIAAGAILRTLEELPTVTRWVAMVQKEVGERLAARARDAGLRPALRAGPARLPTCASTARSHGRSSTRSPTSTACSSSSSAPGPPRPRRCAAWRPTPSPTGARRSRARSPSRPAPRRASATAPARRSRASGSPPTCAPSASRPRTSAACQRGRRAPPPEELEP